MKSERQTVEETAGAANREPESNDVDSKLGERKRPANAYRAVLKVMALLGSTFFTNLGLGLLKTKAFALLLGPSGTGLIGLYSSVSSVVGGVTSLSLGSAAVKEIAEANASADAIRLGRSVLTLRRAVRVTGILGAIVQFALAKILSVWIFKTHEHAWAIRILSLVLLMQAITDGNNALLQGTRRLRALASQSLVGAIVGSLGAVTLVAALGSSGIVPALLIVPCAALLSSWVFSRSVPVLPVTLSWRETLKRARGTISLGAYFSVSLLATNVTAFLVGSFVSRNFGLKAVGLTQAASTLSGVLIGFLTWALSTDYYPRLVGAKDDAIAFRGVVRRQAEITLLLGAPAIAITLVAGKLALSLLYSSQFVPAADLLRWLLPGVVLRLVSWPLAYIFLARDRAMWLLAAEVCANVIYLTLVVILGRLFGLEGVAAAFPCLYLVFGLIIAAMASRQLNVRYDRHYMLLLVVVALSLALCWPAAGAGASPPAAAIGVGAAFLLTIGAAYALSRRAEVRLVNVMSGFRRKRKA